MAAKTICSVCGNEIPLKRKGWSTCNTECARKRTPKPKVKEPKTKAPVKIKPKPAAKLRATKAEKVIDPKKEKIIKEVVPKEYTLGYVYVIGPEEGNGPYKIGYSASPIDRLGSLQTSHWVRLKIFSVYVGTYGLEKTLHRLFADKNLLNEWFDLSEDDLQMIHEKAGTFVELEIEEKKPNLVVWRPVVDWEPIKREYDISSAILDDSLTTLTKWFKDRGRAFRNFPPEDQETYLRQYLDHVFGL